ncbi:MAG: SCP2 sterol-binding domain-containing protein [Desulfobacterales bacterium]
MGFEFLSDDWFDKVKELTVSAGDLGLSDDAKALIMNIKVTGDKSNCAMCINGGIISKGLNTAAPITISVSSDIARKMFVDQDQNAGTQAYMSGKLKIEGDMSKLIASVSIQPTPAQQALSGQIQDITE